MMLGFQGHHWQLDVGEMCVYSVRPAGEPPSHPCAFPQVRGQFLRI